MQSKSNEQRSYEGHRHANLTDNKSLNKINPKPKGKLKKPNGMDKEAKKLWDEMVPQLEAMGLVGAIDETALIGLCHWWAAYLKSREALENVQDYSSIEGSRALNAVKTCWKEYLTLAESFGLTPYARSSIHVEQPTSQDEELRQLQEEPYSIF